MELPIGRPILSDRAEFHSYQRLGRKGSELAAEGQDVALFGGVIAVAQENDPGVAAGILPQGGDPLILDRMLRALLQAQRLILQHRVGRVKAPIVYFRADDNDCPDVPGMLAATTTGSFIEIAVGARHTALCDPEPAAVIGAEVNRYLLQGGMTRGC